jgi:uncharacterized protein YndB with AHSA1/START domain
MSSKRKKTKNTTTKTVPSATSSDREFVITRIIDAPRERVFKAWTEPELLKQWFAPLPSTTPAAELDVRPGGSNLIVMRGADGKDLPNRGVYLEVMIVTLEDNGGKTKYTASVRHWTVADRKAHKKMGFHQGWSQCADQVEALVTRS